MAAIATIVSGSETDEHVRKLDKTPRVEASTIWPVNGWGITDMVMGALTGSYVQFQGKANGNDCESRWISESMALVATSRYFNKDFMINSD